MACNRVLKLLFPGALLRGFDVAAGWARLQGEACLARRLVSGLDPGAHR